MACCHIIAAATNKTNPPSTKTPAPPISHAGIATVAFIYLFVIIYNMSWGALPWPYVSEIFPTRIREPGIATGVAAQWLFAFVYTLTTPYMVKNMGWGTFLLWGIFNLVIAVFSFLVLKETRGKSLETINAQFAAGDEGEHILHKAVDRKFEQALSGQRTPSPEATGKFPAGTTSQVVPNGI